MSALRAKPRVAAVVGGGVIGGGWVARFALMGWQVNVFDPDPEAERKVTEVLNNARHALPALYDTRLPEEGKIIFCSTLAEAVADVEWVTESVPERLELKQSVHAEIIQNAPAGTVVSSSTSGFKPSELNAELDTPRIIVAHPFNPVYLLPVVELVGPDEWMAPAAAVLEAIGMKPTVIKKEIDAHVADRLLEAVWREALWLVKDDIATTEEVDDIMRFGFGLRWAQMGLFETYRVAGGEAGMAHFIGQFGPALKWPWTKLMDVPELTDELVNKIASQSDAQSGAHSIRELERIRDNNLVAIMRALKTQNWGAGELLNELDARARQAAPSVDFSQPLETVSRTVPIDWTDYNGHMNEARYAQVFSDAADGFMQLVGADQAYIESGYSFFTVETNIRYLVECHAGDAFTVQSRVLLFEGKKVKLHHTMLSADGTTLCEGEQFMLHVDLSARASCPPQPELAATLSMVAKHHEALKQ